MHIWFSFPFSLQMVYTYCYNFNPFAFNVTRNFFFSENKTNKTNNNHTHNVSFIINCICFRVLENSPLSGTFSFLNYYLSNWKPVDVHRKTAWLALYRSNDLKTRQTVWQNQYKIVLTIINFERPAIENQKKEKKIMRIK